MFTKNVGDLLGDGVDLLVDGVDLLGDGVDLLGDGGNLLSDGGDLLGDGGNGRATRDWKSESVTNQLTDLLTYLLSWVGARDTCVYNNQKVACNRYNYIVTYFGQSFSLPTAPGRADNPQGLFCTCGCF